VPDVTINELLDRLRSEGTQDTYPVASADALAVTEAAIGKQLPDSYRTFVQQFSNGAYLFGVHEVSAVGEGNRQITAIQDIHRSPVDPHDTIPFREGGSTAFGNLIPFGLDSNGNEWCFVGEGDPGGHEYALAYYDSGGKKLFGRLESFTDWIERLIQTQDEVIRTLYGDDVLYDELQLG
jgi:SMI1 / KNR4 family (SUKH-1)